MSGTTYEERAFNAENEADRLHRELAEAISDCKRLAALAKAVIEERDEARRVNSNLRNDVRRLAPLLVLEREKLAEARELLREASQSGMLWPDMVDRIYAFLTTADQPADVEPTLARCDFCGSLQGHAHTAGCQHPYATADKS